MALEAWRDRGVLFWKAPAFDTQSLTTVMDLKVQNQSGCTIHAVTEDSSGGVLTAYYVYTDKRGTEVKEVLYTTTTLTTDVLSVINYDYPIDHLRIKYDSGGASPSQTTFISLKWKK